MGNSGPKDNISFVENNLQLNKVKIRDFEIALFTLNNLNKIYKQKMFKMVDNLGFNYSATQKKEYNAYLTAFQYNVLQQSCLNFDNLLLVLQVNSKDSLKEILNKVFMNQTMVTVDEFKQKVNQLVDLVIKYSDALSLWINFQNKENNENLNNQFHNIFYQYYKLKVDRAIHKQMIQNKNNFIDNIANKVFDKKAGMIQSVSIDKLAKKLTLKELKSNWIRNKIQYCFDDKLEFLERLEDLQGSLKID